MRFDAGTLSLFISSEFYDGRPHSHPGSAERSTSAGTGLKLLTVEHAGNSSHAHEEVEAIGRQIERLLCETLTKATASARSSATTSWSSRPTTPRSGCYGPRCP